MIEIKDHSMRYFKPSLCLKHYIAELVLRTALTQTHYYLIQQQSTFEPCSHRKFSSTPFESNHECD